MLFRLKGAKNDYRVNVNVLRIYNDCIGVFFNFLIKSYVP